MESLGLLEDAVKSTRLRDGKRRSKVDNFEKASSLTDIMGFIRGIVSSRQDLSRERLLNILNFLVAEIDGLLNRQVNAIIHARKFQRLEASWRGLAWLTQQAENKENVKIKVIDLSWRELSKDLERAIEFDQSQIFKKVYSAEYDTPGGEPYGVLLGDYYVAHCPTQDAPYDNLNVLAEMSHVAAAAFAPFVASAHPRLFGLSTFDGLGKPIDFDLSFRQPEYAKWNSFRESEDSRFVGLVAPRILMRKPYQTNTFRRDGFPFRENVQGKDNRNYLWGNACYAFGAVLMQAFDKYGWFADIRGSYQGVGEGGVVSDLVVDYFKSDRANVIHKFATEVLITDAREKTLSEYGIIPLCHSKGTSYAVFYGNQSVQGQLNYNKPEARANARLSAMLQYIFCVSRFAHFIKLIGRDKIGSLMTASEVEEYIRKWLFDYTTASAVDSYETRARYPLSESRIEVREIPGKPGIFGCVVYLKPHGQIDQMMSSIKLVTEVAAQKA